MIVSICDDNSIGREVLRALLLEYQKNIKGDYINESPNE